MVGVRICLALCQIEEMRKIKLFLANYGFSVISESTDGSSVLRHIRTLNPDLIVVDSELPGINGIRIAEIAEEDDIAPVIVITNSTKDSLWIDLEHPRGIVFLQRPITKSALLQTIQLSLLNYRRIKELKEEVKKLKETLEARKLIEEAKGILMKKNDISEGEAYRLMQKQSMDRGIPLRELANAIILANRMELLD